MSEFQFHDDLARVDALALKCLYLGLGFEFLNFDSDVDKDVVRRFLPAGSFGFSRNTVTNWQAPPVSSAMM